MKLIFKVAEILSLKFNLSFGFFALCNNFKTLRRGRKITYTFDSLTEMIFVHSGVSQKNFRNHVWSM